MLGSAPLAALAVLCFGGVGVYIVNPSLMSWSSVHVPNSIRWLGAGLGWTGALGEIWALVYLGRQYRPHSKSSARSRARRAGAVCLGPTPCV